ncbi:MAG TPA: ATP-binding protein [Bacteroidales bacterium]|nr:ATP-binding protein [Bacteroidales bacterium]
MKNKRLKELSVRVSGPVQYLFVLLIIAFTVALCRPLATQHGYLIVAFLLLAEVSVMALLFGIGPILLASTISALVWNFFFIPPHFAFHIERTEDKIIFVSFFFVALINGVLTNRIRRQEEVTRLKEEQALLLAESDKLYKTLFTLISHEFRIPIATIMGASDTLLTSPTSESDKTALFREILKASTRLNHLIENLLNMSRLESGKISVKRDWCDINDLLNKVTSTLSQQLEQFRVESSVPSDMPLVKLDFGLMEQVIYNLILNATQHAPAGSVINFTAGYSEGRLKIVISDSGPGFTPEQLQKLFTKFYRVDSTRAGGLGLGLSIVKGLVEAHKGTILAGNSGGSGAVFTILIPTEIPDMEKINSVQ